MSERKGQMLTAHRLSNDMGITRNSCCPVSNGAPVTETCVSQALKETTICQSLEVLKLIEFSQNARTITSGEFCIFPTFIYTFTVLCNDLISILVFFQS